MPRPATGNYRQRGGRVLASIPAPRGTAGRVERSFPDDASAKRWVADCLAARNDDRPYPDADNYQHSVARVVALKMQPRSFSETAWAWWREVYVEDRRALPERRASVETMLRRRIVPFFDAQVDSIDQLRRDHVREFVRFLAGYDPLPRSLRQRRLTAVPTTSLTITQAAEHCGVSRSTIRRRWLDGRFPNAGRRRGSVDIEIPITDLVAAGLVDRAVTLNNRSPAWALRKTTAGGHLAVLREVIAYAIAHREIDTDPSNGINVMPPNPDRTTHRHAKRKKYVFEYPVCAKVVQHLHIHHAVAFWIQRVIGLRVGEVFGLHVGDIGDFGDFGLASISRQGGKKRLAYDERGQVVKLDEVERVKTATSSRVIAVPLPLLELLRVYINAFHTDPSTGEVDHDARLIVGLQAANVAGDGAYRTALKKAFAAEGLTYEEIGFSASTHHLRASLGGELKLQLAIDDLIRSEILGHLVRSGGGAAVTMRSYTPALPQLEPFIAIARVQGPFITEQIGSLIIPITHPHPLGHVTHLDEHRLATAHSVLEAAGCIATDSGLITISEAVKVLGESRGVLRQAITQGSVRTTSVEHATGGPVTYVHLDDVLALKLQRQPGDDGISSEEAAQLLAISQWSVRQLILSGALPATKQANNRYRISRAVVETQRDNLMRLAALGERAIRLAEAATRLQLSTHATKRLLQAGKLEADPESALDPNGAFYVTLTSLERYEAETRARAHRARRSAMLPDDWLALEDVIAASGKNRVELLALSGKGLIIKRDLKYKFFVHRESPLLPVLVTAEQ